MDGPTGYLSEIAKDKYMISFIYGFFFFFFLGPQGWHMEVPWLGDELELQLPAYATATAMPDILTHCMRPGTEPTSSWMLTGLITAEPKWELPGIFTT